MPESYKEDGKPSDQWYWDDWFSSHDVHSCSLAAQGLWINLLGIMFASEVRGTLAVNGIQMDNKAIAKRFGKSINTIDKLVSELEEARVFSRLPDGTIYSRRLYRRSKKKGKISKIRSKAGKEGMKKRWGETDKKGNNKKITKITAPSSSPSSSPIPSSKHKDTKVSFPQTEKSNTPKIEFSFKERKFLNINVEDKAGWKDAYPAVDIEQELREMREWLLANPTKRKSNYRKFINNWLSREQDKGGTKSSYEDKRKKALDDWEKKPLED